MYLKKQHLRCLISCFLFLMAGMSAQAQTLIHSTDWTTGTYGSLSTGVAGSTTGAGDGWIDVAGGVATAGSANILTLTSSSVSGAYTTSQYLLRPSIENVLSQGIVATFTQAASEKDRYIILRHVATNTNYLLGYVNNGTALYIFQNNGGSLGQIGTNASFSAPTAGHTIRLTTSIAGTTSNVLTITAYDVTAGSQVGTFTATDNSPPTALQSAGQCGLMVNLGAGTYLTAASYNNAPVGPPSLGSITANSATSSTITPQVTVTGGTAPYSVQFSYSTTSGGSYTNIGSAVTVSSSGGTALSSPQTGLAASTTYYFKALVTDSATLTASAGPTALATSSNSTTTIAMNNAGLLYSPYNWLVTSGSAKTINAGAYFRTIFSGTSLSLTTDTSANNSPYPQIWARVDNGAWIEYTLSTGNPTLSIASGLASRKHLLEVVLKSISYTLDRWNSQTAGLTITGITLDSGSTLTSPQRKAYNVLIYGDSITEGLRTVSSGANPETNDGDALQGWAYALSQLGPYEVGIVGFGATGISVAGQGNVPSLPSSYNLLWSGQSRLFTTVPDLVIYNEGTNDGTTNIVAAYTGVVNAMAALSPPPKQILMRPFNGNQATNVQSVVTAISSANITYLDTTGWWNSADSADGLHPYGYADVGLIAPRLAAAVKTVMGGSITTVSGQKRKAQ